jgi:hypothetical protein
MCNAVQMKLVIWDPIRLRKIYIKLYNIIVLVIPWPVIMSKLCMSARPAVCPSKYVMILPKSSEPISQV